jgi:hypothetical protein
VRQYLDDILLLAGYALIVYGVAQYSVSAGCIVAGLCLITLAYMVAKSVTKG